MSEQPEALRLADAFGIQHWTGLPIALHVEAAAELRRLHQSESEGWRYANELEQERRRLYDVNAELLKAVKYIANCCQLSLDNPKFRIDETSCDLIRTAIAKATGEQP